MLKCSSLALLVLAGGIGAQTLKSFVAPAGFGYATKAGESSTSTPFTTTYARNQELFLNSALGFKAGLIHQVEFRRDNRPTQSYAASTETVICRLGYTAHTPDSMPSKFSLVAPITKMTEVFKGTLNLPAASGTPTPPHPWSVTVKFPKPWLFVTVKGNLVLDLESSSTAYNTWRRDARWVARAGGANGSYTSLGLGCVNSSGRAMYTYPTPTSNAVPGKTMHMYMYGAPLTQKVGFNFMGLRSAAPTFPVDLTAVGMGGCKLYTDIFLVQPVILGNPSTTYNRGDAYWRIPNVTGAAGFVVNSQWFCLDTKTTTNTWGMFWSRGVKITLGTPGTRKYMVQTNWTYKKGSDPASQSSYEYGTIVKFTGALN